MHRNFLKKLLENYLPVYAEEKECKKRMLSFLSAYPDCFLRSCLPGHFTASAWLVNADHSKILLMHHKKLNKWLQPGGHCDGDGDLLRVAIKEAREESGIDNVVPIQKSIFDIDMHLIPQIGTELPHYHFDIRFLLKVDGDGALKINSESKALKWFEPNNGDFLTSETSILRMLKNWQVLAKAYEVE